MKQEKYTTATSQNFPNTSRVTGQTIPGGSDAWMGKVSSMLSRYVHGTISLADTARISEPSTTQTVGPGVVISERYRVQRLIGQGGMGCVYEVVHNTLGKSFALKLMSDTINAPEDVQRLFFREARYASRLQHSSLPDVVDFGQDPNFGWFMVLEYLEGQSLSAMVKRKKKLRIKHAAKIVLQVAEALKAMHDSGLVHCDIKTENIMITMETNGSRRRELVKLIDFGLARSKALAPQELAYGTPHYLAPEIIGGAQPSPSSDIYALGVVFYYLLAGKVPFEGTMSEIFAGHHGTPPPTLVGIPEMTEPIDSLVAKALSKTPEARHPNISEFIYELRAAMNMIGMKRGSGRADSEISLAEGQFIGLELPVPIAIILESGAIQSNSLAFAKVAVGASVNLATTSLLETALAHFWTDVESDIASAAEGNSVRRILELADVDGESTRLMACVDPISQAGQICVWLYPRY